jgi:hypothetical protein
MTHWRHEANGWVASWQPHRKILLHITRTGWTAQLQESHRVVKAAFPFDTRQEAAVAGENLAEEIWGPAGQQDPP